MFIHSYNDCFIYILIPYFSSFFVYWFITFIFLLFDLYIDSKHRVQPDPIDWKLYVKSFYHVIYLQFFYSLPVMYLSLPLYKNRNDILYENIHIVVEIPKFIITIFVAELFFYNLHYLSHIIFYSHVHKIHHQWKNTCAISAAYVHPLEYLFVSLPTFILPPIIVGNHWYFTNIWFIFATFNVVIDHSGYKWFSSSIHHYNHHKYTNINYGNKLFYDLYYNSQSYIKKYCQE